MTIWLEISQENLAHNLYATGAAAGKDTEVLAVVKANAYGHGVEICSTMLAHAGARWLGVTDAREGAAVRRALDKSGRPAHSIDILIMSGFLPADVADIRQHRLTPVVWTAEQVSWLRGSGLPVHVEVDTGMGRQGARPGRELDDLLVLLQTAGLKLDGLFTHLCCSEVAHSETTQLQRRRVEAAVAQVLVRGISPSWIHAANSSAVDNPVQPATWLADLARSVGARPLVRTGLALYGYCLPIEDDASDPAPAPTLAPSLKPVMQWKTSILAVRDLAADDTVGYGATFTASGPMRVALLPVGYADGLRRELSSTNQKAGGWVMINGRRAAILGRVSMNLTVVDVTGIAGVAAGDEAVLLGEGITAEDHALLTGTIPYEILCGIKTR